MSDPFIQVGEFHKAMGQPSLKTPDVPSIERVQLRLSLLLEEVEEVINAVRGGSESQRLTKIEFWLSRMRELVWELESQDIAQVDIVNLGKELADVQVVVNGMAHEFGLPLNVIMDEVHRSNMSKLGDDGKPIFDGTRKVMKGPNYSPADVASVLYPKAVEPVFKYDPPKVNPAPKGPTKR